MCIFIIDDEDIALFIDTDRVYRDRVMRDQAEWNGDAVSTRLEASAELGSEGRLDRGAVLVPGDGCEGMGCVYREGYSQAKAGRVDLRGKGALTGGPEGVEDKDKE